jgi:hypothetical protein
MDPEQIRQRVARFPRWQYQFDLDGVQTPLENPDDFNRQQQRVRYFFNPLLSLTGGSLKGKRVLDLACNAGF